MLAMLTWVYIGCELTFPTGVSKPSKHAGVLFFILSLFKSGFSDVDTEMSFSKCLFLFPEQAVSTPISLHFY